MHLAILLPAIVIALCLVTTPKWLYRTLKWTMVLGVLATTLWVISHNSLPYWLVILTALCQEYQIGNPQGWVNQSLAYRSFISSLYYLTFTGAIVLFLLGLTDENKEVKQFKAIPKSKVWGIFVFIIIFSLCLYVGFFLEGKPILTKEVLYRNTMAFFINTPYGLLFFIYLLLSMTNYTASIIRALVWQVTSLLPSTTNKEINDE